MDMVTFFQPALGAVIGGSMALLGGYFQAKRTDKSTRATELRKLSHDSAREITTQMARLSGIARRHRDGNSLDLTDEGQTELWDCCSAMENNARYITEKPLREAVNEAVSFLRPPPHFEELSGKSVPGIVHDLERWLGPMVQAHILSREKPGEPDFLKNYRDSLADAEDMWNEQVQMQEEYNAAEREKRRKAREQNDEV